MIVKVAQLATECHLADEEVIRPQTLVLVQQANYESLTYLLQNTTKNDIYSCKSMVTSVLAKVDLMDPPSPDNSLILRNLVCVLGEKYNQLSLKK